MEVGSPFFINDKTPSLVIKNARWFPVAVTLSNSGDEVSGRVTLRLTDSSQQGERSATFYSDVKLPAKAARKRVWVYGRADGDNAFDGAEVSFEGSGFTALRQKLGLVVPELGQRLILTISDSGEKLGFLSSLSDEKMANQTELAAYQKSSGGYSGRPNKTNTVSAFNAPRDLVPDRFIGLESADAVMLSDFPHTALSPEQIAALQNYTAAGGLLIIRGGADWQRLASSPLNALWPLNPTSSRVATPSETATLVNAYARNLKGFDAGDKLGGAPALLMSGTVLPDARALPGASLMTVRGVGAGRVLALSFDPMQPPFAGWRGQKSLWTQVFQQVPQARRLESVDRLNTYNFNNYGQQQNTGGDVTAALLAPIRKLPQLQTPPASLIAWFLALYVFVLVPVNYFVLRRLDKRELAWLTVPIIAVAFSFASYVAARKIKGSDLLVRRVNLVQGSVDASTRKGAMARSDALLWMFSPSKTVYQISSSDPQMAASDYIVPSRGYNDRGATTRLTVAQPDAVTPFKLEDNDVKMWSEATFVGETVADAKGGIGATKRGNVVSFANGTPQNWRGAVLVYRGQVTPINDFAAGATKNVTLPSAPPIAKVPLSRRKGASPIIGNTTDSIAGRIAAASQLPQIFDVGQKKLASGDSSAQTAKLSEVAQNVLSASLAAGDGSETPLLIGWSAEPVSSLQLDSADARSQNITLFLYRLPWLK